jgi:tetratricopeptide (TPR) repeat protein
MNAQDYLNRGIEYFNQENYDGAIIEFTEALRQEPDFVAAKDNLSATYLSRGVTSYKKGDDNKAITDLNEAMALNPNDVQIHTMRGIINGKMGNHDAEINDFTEVIRIAPTASAYHFRFSAYYDKCKEARHTDDKTGFFKFIDLAIKDIEAASQMDPDNEDYQKILELTVSEQEHRRQVFDYIG